MSEKNVHTRGDDQITVVNSTATQINNSSNQFVRVTIQANFANNGTILVGGADPKLELLPGGSHTFENGFLNQIYYKGDTNGDKLNIHYEY